MYVFFFFLVSLILINIDNLAGESRHSGLFASNCDVPKLRRDVPKFRRVTLTRPSGSSFLFSLKSPPTPKNGRIPSSSSTWQVGLFAHAAVRK